MQTLPAAWSGSLRPRTILGLLRARHPGPTSTQNRFGLAALYRLSKSPPPMPPNMLRFYRYVCIYMFGPLEGAWGEYMAPRQGHNPGMACPRHTQLFTVDVAMGRIRSEERRVG